MYRKNEACWDYTLKILDIFDKLIQIFGSIIHLVYFYKTSFIFSFVENEVYETFDSYAPTNRYRKKKKILNFT